MFAVHARYRGKDRRRAVLVRQAAEALSTLPNGGTFEVIGVEDIAANIDSAAAVVDTTMALLSAGDWAIGIGVVEVGATGLTADEFVRDQAAKALAKQARPGVVKVQSTPHANWAADLQHCFTMIAHTLHKRTTEGREATSLMRSGLNQNEAAEHLGISKQAMSQRLQAAGWQSELAGYQLAISLLTRAAGLPLQG